MKVCLLSHCFYPSKKRGGPTVSVTNMVKNLADKCELSVVTIIFDKGTDRPYDNVSEGKNRLFDSDIYYLSKNTEEAFYTAISEISPDVIYVSSLFSSQYSLAAMKYARKHKEVRLIIAPRGELMPSALKRKKIKKIPFLWYVKSLMTAQTEFHVTSDEEEAALKKHFKKHRVWKIKNLPSKISAEAERIEKQAGTLNIVMIGRIHPIKNVDYAIDLMNDVTGDITLNIYGPEEDEKYVALCKESVKALPESIKVNFQGTLDHDEVGNALSAHHIFLSPTQSENYGHSIIEGMLCGLPAVISTGTPWHELEANRAGYDINLENREQFVKALQNFIDMDEATYREWSANASAYISSKLAVQETVDAYTQMLTKK